MMKAYSAPFSAALLLRQCGHLRTRRRLVPQRRTRCVRARRWHLLFTPSVARRRLRRELSLGAVCWPRDRQRRGVVIRTSALSATSRLSWRRLLAGARSRTWGGAMQARSDSVETFVAFVRPPMQKRGTPLPESSSSFGSPGDAQSPNHAMQRTAGRSAF